MSFINAYIHLVWATKNRAPLLDSADKREIVWRHIRENARKKGIFVDEINGYSNHCHCLISLEADQKISDIAMLLKGESSHWINQQGLCSEKFGWQGEYYAAAVANDNVVQVRDYIRRQEEHHAIRTFEQECREMKISFGIE